MVFDDARDAAHYALELSALVNGTDWTAHGLPANFNLRIALHCGPVYCGRDPVTQAPLFTGPHTSRAARIEPITPPGQVYASSAFAAVAAARGADGLDDALRGQDSARQAQRFTRALSPAAGTLSGQRAGPRSISTSDSSSTPSEAAKSA